jgi:hypothetical protein
VGINDNSGGGGGGVDDNGNMGDDDKSPADSSWPIANIFLGYGFANSCVMFGRLVGQGF